METQPQQSPFDGLRIVLFGPESTGKSTLAKQLAQHFNTQWVPEFARDYLQHKWDTKGEVCNQQDLLTIAEGQLTWENKHAAMAQRFLFCDTNIRVTQIWSETHFNGYCDPKIKRWTQLLQYDHYFLTDIDIPWEADDLRDRPNDRAQMKNTFHEHLLQNGCSFTEISGSKSERFQKAIAVLESL